MEDRTNYTGLKIPITFDYEGKEYKGEFNAVAGSTFNFHLMISDLYQGQIFYTGVYGWRFYGNSDKFNILSTYFGAYITAYLQ